MKLNEIIYLLISVSIITHSISIKIRNSQEDIVTKICEDLKKKKLEQIKPDNKTDINPDNKTDNNPNNKTDINPDNKPSYIDLVISPNRPKCPIVLDPKAPIRNIKKYETGTFPSQGPYVQPNPFKIMSTPDTLFINYLWDYLDEMIIKKIENKKFTEIIIKKFSESFEEAKKMKKTNPLYSNPYTAPKLLFYFSKGAAGTEPFTDPRLISQKAISNSQIATPSGMVPASPPSLKPDPDDKIFPEEIFLSIKSYNKDFDKAIFENGITPIQVMHILNEWGWGAPGEERDIMAVKRIVDKYDFNGDGNLNPEEFTIFQIHYTINMGYQCIKNCFREIIDKVLEPLFMYLDCDSDGYVNSENLWEGFKNINRNGSDKYNMYKCKFPVELNQDYRTNTVSAFILKGSFAADGFLTKEEFIKGILTGFWERETSPSSYGDNVDKMKGLTLRWNSNGSKDKECSEVLYYFNK